MNNQSYKKPATEPQVYTKINLKTCNVSVINLLSSQLTYRGETYTGEKFNNTVICSVDFNNEHIRILFNHWGDMLNDRFIIDRIASYFGFEFNPGFLDGKPCYINSNPI